jgi:cysteine synthase A
MPFPSILDAIGNTPLIQLDDVFIKCEFMNPSGSIKARVAKYIVEKAENEGRIKPGDTLVEATSGNMGNALAMVAAAKGYKMVVVTPTGFSSERVSISNAFGAEVRFIGNFHLPKAVSVAKELGQQKGFFCTRQFENPLNIEENHHWLGREVISQLPKGIKIDAVVQGVGTGGTLIGLGKAIREYNNPDVKLFAVEPTESTTLLTGAVGCHVIEGISDGFVPTLYEQHRHEIFDVIAIPGEEAIKHMKRLTSKYGLLVGPSSGANFLAVQEVKRRFPYMGHILTLFCDEGEKYLSQHYKV